jgi:hypothetical protein
MNKLKVVINTMNDKFTSTNSNPVERTTITIEQWNVIQSKLAALKSDQSRLIDTLVVFRDRAIGDAEIAGDRYYDGKDFGYSHAIEIIKSSPPVTPPNTK